jgi:hypothetical protein
MEDAIALFRFVRKVLGNGEEFTCPNLAGP